MSPFSNRIWSRFRDRLLSSFISKDFYARLHWMYTINSLTADNNEKSTYPTMPNAYCFICKNGKKHSVAVARHIFYWWVSFALRKRAGPSERKIHHPARIRKAIKHLKKSQSKHNRRRDFLQAQLHWIRGLRARDKTNDAWMELWWCDQITAFAKIATPRKAVVEFVCMQVRRHSTRYWNLVNIHKAICILTSRTK